MRMARVMPFFIQMIRKPIHMSRERTFIQIVIITNIIQTIR